MRYLPVIYWFVYFSSNNFLISSILDYSNWSISITLQHLEIWKCCQSANFHACHFNIASKISYISCKFFSIVAHNYVILFYLLSVTIIIKKQEREIKLNTRSMLLRQASRTCSPHNCFTCNEKEPIRVHSSRIPLLYCKYICTFFHPRSSGVLYCTLLYSCIRMRSYLPNIPDNSCNDFPSRYIDI